MNARNMLKRLSIEVNGHLRACCNNEQEAEDWLKSNWWSGVATVYDHEKHAIIKTEVWL